MIFCVLNKRDLVFLCVFRVVFFLSSYLCSRRFRSIRHSVLSGCTLAAGRSHASKLAARLFVCSPVGRIRDISYVLSAA